MKKEKHYFYPHKDGFYGVYYPCAEKTDKAFIVMLGDSSDDRMAQSGAKWMQKLGCNVMAMSPSGLGLRTASGKYIGSRSPAEPSLSAMSPTVKPTRTISGWKRSAA